MWPFMYSCISKNRIEIHKKIIQILACTISTQKKYFYWFTYFEWKKDQLIVEQNIKIPAIVLAAVVL